MDICVEELRLVGVYKTKAIAVTAAELADEAKGADKVFTARSIYHRRLCNVEFF